jgi:hypothetical protein
MRTVLRNPRESSKVRQLHLSQWPMELHSAQQLLHEDTATKVHLKLDGDFEVHFCTSFTFSQPFHEYTESIFYPILEF